MKAERQVACKVDHAERREKEVQRAALESSVKLVEKDGEEGHENGEVQNGVERGHGDGESVHFPGEAYRHVGEQEHHPRGPTATHVAGLAVHVMWWCY